MGDFDISFDYKTDNPRTNKPDADRDSQKLRSDHELLWTKELPTGVLFAPSISSARKNEYLIFTDADNKRHCYGSDAITSSYTTWSKPKSLVNAIADLDKDQRSRFLNPPYTIGSSMIWPVRKADRPTINQARGLRLKVADRIDLTLECIRRHYAGEPKSPLADVINAYKEFFELFQDFKGFVDFFHFQDLVTPEYDRIQLFLPCNIFEPSGPPATTDEYVTYREATLDFIAKRGQRMADWVTENHPEIEVRR
jgi:hypothetical protein